MDWGLWLLGVAAGRPASHKLQVIGGGAARGLGVVAAGGGGRPAG
jgi:hypothetical protein